MNEKTLSNRLQLVASFLPPQTFFADIGSDHAYLPCYVCLNDDKARAIAGEINQGPFESAQKTVKDLLLEDRIDVRKGDGLSVLRDDEVTEVVIAGMGGSLITQILTKGKSKLDTVRRIITQPNVDAYSVRKWFFANGYQLSNEKIINEDGHIYEILVADQSNGDSIYSETDKDKEFLFGPYLLKEKSQTFKQKWQAEKLKRQQAIDQMVQAKLPNQKRIKQFKDEIEMIEEVLK